MSTKLYSKKDFIAVIKKTIPDGSFVAATSEIDGTISMSIKRNWVKIPYVFAADAFASGDCRIANLPSICFIIVPANELSSGAMDVLKKPK